MKVNQAGIDLIKEFEGFRSQAYQDSVGVWTIGYGTTGRAGVGIDPKHGMVISRKEAELYLERAVNKFAAQVEGLLRQPYNENEFAAMVSLAYNIGPGAFSTSSVLRYFNQGNKAKAADSFRLWNKAGGKVLNGLVRRREAERKLFLEPVEETKRKRDLLYYIKRWLNG